MAARTLCSVTISNPDAVGLKVPPTGGSTRTPESPVYTNSDPAGATTPLAADTPTPKSS